MDLLQKDPFQPQLKTHKLKGILEGCWACSVEYNLRIVFDFVKNHVTDDTEILLINIGTHEEVYLICIIRMNVPSSLKTSQDRMFV